MTHKIRRNKVDSDYAWMREVLLERHLKLMLDRGEPLENRVHIQEFPQLHVCWFADRNLQKEIVPSTPSSLAAAIIKHANDGELSVRSPDGMEVLIAAQGFVLKCEDISYWKVLNGELNTADFVNEQTSEMRSGFNFEMKGM